MMSQDDMEAAPPERPRRTRSWREAKRIDDDLRRSARRDKVEAAAEPEPAAAASDLAGDILARLQNALGLSDVDLGAVFAVDPTAIEEWRRRGVPPSRHETLLRLHEVARRLDTHGRERLPAEAVRTPVPSLGGRTLLDLLIAHDDGFARALEESALTGGATMRPMTTSAVRSTEGRSVGDVMTREPVVVDSTDALEHAAHRMRGADVGDVFVIENGVLAGVLTDRDIVVRAIAEKRDPRVTPVAAVCSRDVVSVSPGTPVDEAARLMAERAVRRLPVTERGILVGAVSLGDLSVAEAPESALAAIVAAPSTD
jgi:CBS domain-containing protein